MKVDFSDRDLETLRRLNRLRSGGPSPELVALGRKLDSKYEASTRLAVYGSLAPGRSNHGELAGLAGEWIANLAVRGELKEQGWGIHLGFPALRWSPDGALVPAQLFVSADLPGHWPRLDRFEGPDYQRILVPMLDHDGDVAAVANLYQTVDRSMNG